MNRARVLSPILLAAFLAGCDRKPSVAPAAKAEPVPPAAEPSRTDREEIAALEKAVRDSSRAPAERREALIERSKRLGLRVPEKFERAGPPPPRVEIALPDGPPRLDPIESGTYLLSISVGFAGGPSQEERAPASVERDGETLRIRRQEPGSEPLAATLQEGRLTAVGFEGGLSFRLEGQVTGPGRLAGRVTGTAPGTEIRDGRWSLERVK